MKIVQMNATCGAGSTGKICVAISKLLTSSGMENYILYTYGKSDYPLGVRYSCKAYIKLQALKSRILGNYGFNSELATMRLIRLLDQMQPDIIHLHNIHGHDCNLSMLFRYVKRKKIKIMWTFHDCWAFTGLCTHFDYVKCEKWKKTCMNCPQRKGCSWFFDRSGSMQNRKKTLFSGLDMTIVTPSQWLAELVKQSFLKDYPVKIIHNGIDLSVFRPTSSNFREKYGIAPEKKILLGVAFGWGARKGLDVFIDLAHRLDPDHYQIVLVGTDETTDEQLPENIISIHRTQNQAELAEVYTAADLFVNPTREENYPTVNMEALACGTPVLTFRTGGSPEILDETCGAVVACDDVDAMEQEIIRICAEAPYSEAACLKRAEGLDHNQRFEEYIHLYESGVNES